MNVLVTGGAGFIGNHLTQRLLNQGYKVRILDNFSNSSVFNVRRFFNNPNFKLLKGDIRNIETVKEACNSIDTIFHLASQIHVDKSIENPKETGEINFNGTLNILETMRQMDIPRMIFASTCEVYGSSEEPINEHHELNPHSPYAGSKVAADRLCYSYFKTYGLDTEIIRNFNTYGQYQKNSGYGSVIPIFIKRVLEGKSPVIYGDGTQTRDFMFIKDAINAYMLMFENDNIKGQVFNFGTGKETSVNELAEKIIKLCGKKLKPEHIEPRPAEVKRLCADITKSQNQLHFTPTWTIDEGLKEYIEWKR